MERERHRRTTEERQLKLEEQLRLEERKLGKPEGKGKSAESLSTTRVQELTQGEIQALQSKIEGLGLEGESKLGKHGPTSSKEKGKGKLDDTNRPSMPSSGKGKGKEKLEEGEQQDGSAESRMPGGYDRGNTTDSLWQGGGSRRVPEGLRQAGCGGGGGGDGSGGCGEGDGGSGGHDSGGGPGKDGGNSGGSDPDAATVRYQQLLSDEARLVEGAAAAYTEHAVAYASAMAQSARAWQEEGLYAESERLLNQALDVLQTALGPSSPDTVKARELLAHALYKQRKFIEAEKLGLQVLDSRISALGKKNPDTIKAMENLARTWSKLGGKDDQVERLRFQILDVLQTTLDSADPVRIDAIAKLAVAKCNLGKFSEAERLQLHVLESRKTSLGKKHTDTIRAMVALARTWRNAGHSDDEAEKMLAEVVKLRHQTLGDSHSDTIDATGELAGILWARSKWPEVEKLETEILEARRRTIGFDHPATIRALARLANVKLRVGDARSAMELQLQLLNATKSPLGLRTEGMKDPSTTKTIEDLARTFSKHGFGRRATELRDRIKEIEEAGGSLVRGSKFKERRRQYCSIN